MPNLVNRLVLKELQSELGTAEGMLVVSFAGLTVKESEALRNDLAKKGAGLTMVRNSLARRVLADRGFEVGANVLVGNTAIVFGDAEAAIHASKLVQSGDIKKAGKVAIRGGVLEGKFLNASDAAALKDVPDRKTLNAQLVGLLASPGRSLVTLMNAVPGGTARVLKARADQLEAAAPSAGGAPAS